METQTETAVTRETLTGATHGLEQRHRSDFAHTINGVQGRMTHRTTKPGRPVALFFKQRWISEARAGRAKVRVVRQARRGSAGWIFIMWSSISGRTVGRAPINT